MDFREEQVLVLASQSEPLPDASEPKGLHQALLGSGASALPLQRT